MSRIGQRKPGSKQGHSRWLNRFWANEAKGYPTTIPNVEGMTKLDAKQTFPPPGYVPFFDEGLGKLPSIVKAGARVFYRSNPGVQKNDYAVPEWAKVIADALPPKRNARLGEAVSACLRNREIRAALLTVVALGDEAAVLRYVEAIVSLTPPT